VAARAKSPFDIATVLARVRDAVHPLPKAAMFALAELGHRSLFEQLVACILSIRTRDEVSPSPPAGCSTRRRPRATSLVSHRRASIG
jgi:endonuclease-3